MIFSLVAMTGLEKCCITSAYLQWLCHSGEWPVGLLFFLEPIVVSQKEKKRGGGGGVGGGGANIRSLRLKNWHPLESTINI